MVRSAPALLLTLAAPAVWADVPKVIVDTVPLHSLVSQVMEGVGTPDILLPAGVSPHDFQFRPSDAARLVDADLVIWTGHELVGWLEEPLETLAAETPTLELLASEGWDKRPIRTEAAFAEGHEDHGHDDEAHAEEEHSDEAHAEEAHDDEHADHDHGHDHAEGGTDPHAWLSPDVATDWLMVIAATLSEADPDNAARYEANAQAAAEGIAALKAELSAQIAPVQGRAYIVPHDAYQYFEVAFGLPAAGAMTLSDASAPGPARLAELRDLVTAGNVVCILTDPETSPEWAEVLGEGTLVSTAMADPDGISLQPGPGLYAEMMRGLTSALVDCLS
jgi:zinc transport system substrate-binding protein